MNQGNSFSFPTGRAPSFGSNNNNPNWIGGNLSRSSSASSLDIAATLFSSIKAAERSAVNGLNVSAVNNLNGWNGMMMQGNNGGGNDFNMNGFNPISNQQQAFASLGLGIQPPAATAAAMAAADLNQGNLSMDEVQRLLSSHVLNQNSAPAPFGQQPANNGFETLASQLFQPQAPQQPTNNLQSLAAQFHQMQQQMELKRQSEMDQLMQLQQHLRLTRSLNQLNQGIQNPAFASAAPVTGQHDFFMPTGGLSQQHGYHPVSVRAGDMRSSHGSISSVSGLFPSNMLNESLNDPQGNSLGNSNTMLTAENLGEHNFFNSFVNNAQQDEMAHNNGMAHKDEIVFVPTKDDTSPRSSFTKSNDSETNSLRSTPASTDVVAGLGGRRNNSSSSFDALLSAVGNDLEEYKKTTSKTDDGNNDNDNQGYESKPSAISTESAFSKSPDMHHLQGLFGNGNDDASSCSGIDPNMALAIREMTAQQLMAQTSSSLASLPRSNSSNLPMSIDDLLNNYNNASLSSQQQQQLKRKSNAESSTCEIENAIMKLSSSLHENPYVPEGRKSQQDPPPSSPPPEESDPQKDLEAFLEEFGQEAETLQKSMLSAISESESSLAKIHEWDRNLGLRKCSNRTVVKTRRSRALIKAFLRGVRPPREPKARRKKSKVE